MIEFRQDPLKKTLTIFSSSRSKRPFIFDVPKGSCFFCKGMEFTTPPTTFYLPDEKNWSVRSFRNAFPILSTQEAFEEKKEGEDREYYHSSGFGDHEVIVETSDHSKMFHDLNDAELSNVWKTYCNRFQNLNQTKGISCAFLFKNHGKRAGASIEHEHSQIIAFPMVPEIIANEVENQYKTGACFFCKLESAEKANLVFETENFAVIASPFARFSFELFIVPKKHVKTMLELDDVHGLELMNILKKLAGKSQAIAPDYNIIYHNAPNNSDLHFHIEFFPRTSDWAGVELGTGIIIRSKGEEEAVEKFK